MDSKMFIAFIIFYISLLSMFADSEGCGFGVGCSPGTCGCGGPCGRRKRFVNAATLQTESSSLCPQPVWKEIIDENLGNDIAETEMSIRDAISQEFNKINFSVSCIENQRNYTVKTNKIDAFHTTDIVAASPKKPTTKNKYSTVPPLRLNFVINGEAYCSSGNKNLWCTVIGLLN